MGDYKKLYNLSFPFSQKTICFDITKDVSLPFNQFEQIVRTHPLGSEWIANGEPPDLWRESSWQKRTLR
jgi:hypothetical protein